ncbi:hypothetical protein CEUSTIGMA_g6492.t1 [Chlamydomonas eustigma]|uniref:Uncharacterized protein n=1 Tax=Chlamydomonas eustigma TaxID=1157962 RepID=A0A250X837_9CHLO|nr:hypothetical protein CEUSTIGMA_g6492.t1 [Chlamydomonas eustigma]|eukprot:GAX79052.1 hypothetical protein CEUSTIGMA_g6492.t1 [Chlamydomonas eustigma]
MGDKTQELLAIASELRDRLRFSENRNLQLKSDLKEQQTLSDRLLQAEKRRSAERLAQLEHEMLRLSDAVELQAKQVTTQEALSQEIQTDLTSQVNQLQSEVTSLILQLNTSNSQLQSAILRTQRAEEERDELVDELAASTQRLQAALGSSSRHEMEHSEALEALLATKSRLGEQSQVQALYLATRDELERLDKENQELKDMLEAGVHELTRSRILEHVPSSRDTAFKPSPLFLSPNGAAYGRPASPSTRASTTSRGRRSGRSISPYRDRVLAATGVMFPADVVESFEGSAAMEGGAMTSWRAAGRSSPYIEHAVDFASMAFLGPPSSAYPADPDKFVFVRVAGGYSPKYVGSDPLPKASGWIPKDVVRLVQAFRQSYGITKVPWRDWEPLLLMVDEVYSMGGHRSLLMSSQNKTSTKKNRKASAFHHLNSSKLAFGPASSPGGGGNYSSVVQAGRIMQLKKELSKTQEQLAAVRGGLPSSTHSQPQYYASSAYSPTAGLGGGRQVPIRSHQDDLFLKSIAEKDYHMSNLLGEAVTENVKLRSQMDDDEHL